MSGYEDVNPFDTVAEWFYENRGRIIRDPVGEADDFFNDMFDSGVLVFGFTQIHDLIDTLKELAQEVAWKTYEDNLVL